jgi:hypothetical protein
MPKRIPLAYKINESTGCFEVTSHVPSNNGYPHFSVKGKLVRASRYAYAEKHGKIPPGLMVLHMCDNRLCINTDHLYLGSAKENSLDSVRRGTSKFLGSRHPKAKLSAAEVVEIRLSNKSPIQLAELFNVSKPTIYRIIQNKIWRHV